MLKSMQNKLSSVFTRLAPSVLVLVAVCGSAQIASASEVEDRLSECLVKTTTEADQKTVLQWTFVALSAHPDLQAYSQVSAEQRKILDQNLAQLLQRILLEQCASETKAVIQADGLQAVGNSFQQLGQITGAQILKTPEIKAQYKSVLSYLDWSKLAVTFLTPDLFQKIGLIRD